MTSDASPGPRATNILLVDDDDIDVMNVQRAFERGRISNPLWVARDGIEGLDLLRSGRMPSERRMVLLDINMPRMSGLEMLRALRADPALQHIPVVMLTTSNDERDRIDAYRLNVAGYLLKPVTFLAFVDLMTALNRYWTLVEMP
ncbi:MAG: response regulator [Kofleriaceae bacterium]